MLLLLSFAWSSCLSGVAICFFSLKIPSFSYCSDLESVIFGFSQVLRVSTLMDVIHERNMDWNEYIISTETVCFTCLCFVFINFFTSQFFFIYLLILFYFKWRLMKYKYYQSIQLLSAIIKEETTIYED